jgi:hypothetical protein
MIDALLKTAADRPLTEEERAALGRAIEAGEAVGVDPLVVAAALGGGSQKLSAPQADAMFERAFAGTKTIKRPTPRWAVGIAAAVAALVAAAVLLKQPPGEDGRLKAGAAEVSLKFAGQVPGRSEARELTAPLKLFEGESLRIVMTSTAPVFVAIYEEDRSGTHRLWSSGAPLPAGQQALGPDLGRTGLLPEKGGTSQFVVLACDREVTFPEQLAPAPGCLVRTLSVETP